MEFSIVFLLFFITRCPGFPQILFEPETPTGEQTGNSRIAANENPLKTLCPTLAAHLYMYYRHDRVSGKCFQAGDRGPCGTNMIFYSEEKGHAEGSCDCDYINQDRELVFDPDSNGCHFVYSQGYCSGDKWLIFNESGLPTCATNPCHRLQESNRTAEFVPFKGNCVPLGSDCGDGKMVGFVRRKLLPTCAVGKLDGFTTLSVTVPKLRCARGSVMNILGKCRPPYKVNLT